MSKINKNNSDKKANQQKNSQKNDQKSSSFVPKLSLNKLDQLNFAADNPSQADPEYYHSFYWVDREWMCEARRCSEKKIKMSESPINENLMKRNYYEFKVHNFTENCQYILKNDLRLWSDYEILTSEAWEYLTKNHEGFQIKSRFETDGEKYFETMRYLSFNLIVKNKEGELSSILIQMNETKKPKEVIEFIRSKFSLGDGNFSLAIVDTRLQLNKIFHNLSKLKVYGSTIDPESFFLFKFLQDFEILIIYENDSLEIMKPEENSSGHCSLCREFAPLEYSCNCILKSYCSLDCKCEDFMIHRFRCENFTGIRSDVERDLNNVEAGQFNKAEIGLKNIGNSCYLNCLIQILKTVPKIRNDFITKNVKNLPESPFVLGFYHIMKKIYYYQKNNLKPWPFKLFLGLTSKQFLNSMQHDSSECLDFILNELNETKDESIRAISSVFKGTTVCRFHCKDCQNIETRAIEDPFFLFPVSLVAEPPSREFNVSVFDDNEDELKLHQHLISLTEKEFTLEKLVEKSLSVKSKGNYLVTAVDNSDELIKISNDAEFQNFIYENTLSSNQALPVSVQTLLHTTNTFLQIVFKDYFLISQKYPQFNKFCRPKYIQFSNEETNQGTSVTFATIHMKVFDLMKGIVFGVFPEVKKLYQETMKVVFPRKKEVFYLALFKIKLEETEVFKFSDELPSESELQEKEMFLKLHREIQEALSFINELKNEKLYSITPTGKTQSTSFSSEKVDLIFNTLEFSHKKQFEFSNQKISNVKIDLNFKKDSKLNLSFHKLTDKEDPKILSSNRGVQKQCFYLRTALDSVFNWEKIERKCEGCGSNNSSMQTTIKKFPEILIIQFKRFKQVYDKFGNQKTVKFDEFVSYDFEINILGEKYDLIGVVNHSGNLNDGHYTCCAFESSNNTWIEYNDNDFEKITDLDDIKRKSNYILFYSRCPKLESCIL
jgi:hypothetical protein